MKKGILFNISLYFLIALSIICNVISFSFGYYEKSIWEMASFLYTSGSTAKVCMILVIIFCVQVLMGIATFLLAFKKRKIGFYFSAGFNLIFAVIMLFIHGFFYLFSIVGIVFIILNLLSMLVALIVLFYLRGKYIKSLAMEVKTKETLVKKILIGLNTFSIIIPSISLFIPIFFKEVNGFKTSFTLISVLGDGRNNIYLYIVFTLMIAFVFFGVIYYFYSISNFMNSQKDYVKESKNSLFLSLLTTLVFFVIGYFTSFYYNLSGERASTISFIPFLIMLLISILYAVLFGKNKVAQAEVIKDKVVSVKRYKFEPLLFVIILSSITVSSLFFNIIKIELEISTFSQFVELTGLQLLSDYGMLGSGFQILAFCIFIVMVSTTVLLVLSITSFFSKFKDYYKIIKTTVYSNVIFMFLIGMSGVYYKITQKINEDNIKSLLDFFKIPIETTYTYSMTSQTLYIFLLSLLVLLVMIARGQLNNTIKEPLMEQVDFSNLNARDSLYQTGSSDALEDFDACPAFTQLDGKKSVYDNELLEKQRNVFEDITLPELVRFIVDYARESRLHLSYSLEDIATFVSGLGASRLTILQGMSGTGKTSLPKIFIEAIMGNCEIIEVGSSWRDKNELLGYYNEFSKRFTPKKFTQCLYKAKLNPEITTFIVLDEMNLSRIEYYFSDFLSLMEHEEDKRELNLLNVQLFRIEDNIKCPYLGLEEGHNIKISNNVWFIGTANRDESTFEISDKVYDRAQTINFNKRALKVPSFNKEIAPKFLPYYKLSELLTQAKNNMEFDAEDNHLIKEAEKLIAPFNISFGNRVLKQMEEFVKIYCSCFGDPDAVINQAIEKILLSKVVSKLEFKNVEYKDKLAQEFDNIGLHLCSAFVRKLNED